MIPIEVPTGVDHLLRVGGIEHHQHAMVTSAGQLLPFDPDSIASD
jgi:hypothetical protein